LKASHQLFFCISLWPTKQKHILRIHSISKKRASTYNFFPNFGTDGKMTVGVTVINVNLGKGVTTGVVDTSGKFVAGINGAGGKFAPGVVDHGGAS
jgi:hypothetical protein